MKNHIPHIFLYVLLSLWGSFTQGQVNDTLPIQWTERGSHSFTPKQTFLNPQVLMSYWGNDPIPLDRFTEKEIQIQRLLNEKEDFFVTESPQSEDGLATLDKDYGLVDQDVITPYTWKWIELAATRKDGIKVNIKLRRPHWWLLQQGLTQLGAEIPLDLAEMEVHGLARVVRIWPNQLDMRIWKGGTNLQPVISVYKHKNPETWDYIVDLGPQQGRDTLSTTAHHPFWSVESKSWEEIGHIPPGGFLALKDQQQAQLMAKHRREARGEYVYNFEVYRDHHYFVGEGLAWVHNCPTRGQALQKSKEWSQVPRNSRGGVDIPMDELNNSSRGKNWEMMKEKGATKLGRRNPNGKNSYMEHPDGHPDAGQPGVPDHHSQGHFHATNPKGETKVFPYKN